MKKIYLVLYVAFVVVSGNAYAALCGASQSIRCSLDAVAVTPTTITGCSEIEQFCYGNYLYKSCVSCQDGYLLADAEGSGVGCGNMPYKTCQATSLGEVCLDMPQTACMGNASMTGMDNCATITTRCFGSTRVNTCSECEEGYTLTDNEFSVDGCPNKYSRKVCGKNLSVEVCDGLQCPAGQKLNTLTCKCENTLNDVSCKSGWYQNPAGTRCYACPENTSTDSGVNSGGMLVMGHGCGINSDTTGGSESCFYSAKDTMILGGSECEYSDDSGVFVYTQDCYYTK